VIGITSHSASIGCTSAVRRQYAVVIETVFFRALARLTLVPAVSTRHATRVQSAVTIDVVVLLVVVCRLSSVVVLACCGGNRHCTFYTVVTSVDSVVNRTQYSVPNDPVNGQLTVNGSLHSIPFNSILTNGQLSVNGRPNGQCNGQLNCCCVVAIGPRTQLP